MTRSESAVAAADPAIAAVYWRQRRAAFTHDWLRNRLLPCLGACVAIARGDAAASGDIVAALLSTVREWSARRDEVLSLVEEFCDVMSPLHAADGVALSSSADVASYLRRTTVEAWKVRHHVVELLADVRTACCAVDHAYAAWTGNFDDAAALASMAEHYRHLARSLSRLPGDGVF